MPRLTERPPVRNPSLIAQSFECHARGEEVAVGVPLGLGRAGPGLFGRRQRLGRTLTPGNEVIQVHAIGSTPCALGRLVQPGHPLWPRLTVEVPDVAIPVPRTRRSAAVDDARREPAPAPSKKAPRGLFHVYSSSFRASGSGDTCRLKYHPWPRQTPSTCRSSLSA